MVHMLAYDNQRDVLEEVTDVTREMIARYSEDFWKLEKIDTMETLCAFFSKKPIVNLACYDVSTNRNIDYLRQLRRNGYADTLLMLLADGRMSPMEYVKPEVLASVLLIKPYTKDLLTEKVREFLLAYCEKEAEQNNNIFSITMKDGTTRIPFHQICFFEAREKKLFARTLSQIEYPFYNTLDELEEILPEQFVRCHRSFIVNWNLVERVDFSDGYIVLSSDLSIPFSRTYKAIVKALR